jgi:formylglycine-generating enzyme required for sulfatase activity
MGSPNADTEARDDEKPAHRVTISQQFYLGKYPVTQAQWEAVMGNNPSPYRVTLYLLRIRVHGQNNMSTYPKHEPHTS